MKRAVTGLLFKTKEKRLQWGVISCKSKNWVIFSLQALLWTFVRVHLRHGTPLCAFNESIPAWFLREGEFLYQITRNCGKCTKNTNCFVDVKQNTSLQLRTSQKLLELTYRCICYHQLKVKRRLTSRKLPRGVPQIF